MSIKVSAMNKIIIKMIAEGMKPSDIAEKIGITRKQLQNRHITPLLDILGADNQAALVNRAWELGLLSPRVAMPELPQPEKLKACESCAHWRSWVIKLARMYPVLDALLGHHMSNIKVRAMRKELNDLRVELGGMGLPGSIIGRSKAGRIVQRSGV